MVQYQQGELHKEAHPEKDVKLDDALVYLVDREHLLDSSIGSQEFVHLPAKLIIDCPGKRDVSKFCNANDNWEGGCENVDIQVREATL